MTTLPEEAVKAAIAAHNKYYDDLVIYPSEEPTPEGAFHAALKGALPFLPVQGAVKKLEWRKGRAETPFGPYHVIEETNDDEPFWFVMFNGKAAARCGTHDDEESAIFAAQADYEARILSALEPSAARELALEEALRKLINELSGNTGELIDRMAAAIRDWGSHYDDGPWETLPEDRKAGWRGDAERALAVVKEYLTTRALSSPDHADAGKVEGGWLPIESAPKDGTYVLACRAHSILPLIIRFDKKYGEWESAQGDHVYNILGWRPLPTPPEGAE